MLTSVAFMSTSPPFWPPCTDSQLFLVLGLIFFVFCIQVKVLFSFKALNGLAPTYSVQPRSVQRSLRSSNKGLLHVPRSGLKQRADRAFGVAAPRLWNHLPLDIRSAPSISAFKPRLKTHLYSLAFLVP